jgi:putative sigma-54 modulation protein
MELRITGKNMEITPAVRGYVERKLDKVGRHLNNVMESKIEITEEKTRAPENRFVVQLTVDSSGATLRAEERGEDMFTAIDRVEAVIMRRIERYKGKRYDRGRGSSAAREGYRGGGVVSEDKRVVKVKRFAVKPMPLSEATEQMELLGHDFFLFLNADTNKVNLVYRRRNGNYGLIEPELG